MANFPYIIVVTLVLLFLRIRKRKADEEKLRIESQKHIKWEKEKTESHDTTRLEADTENTKRTTEKK